MPYSTAGKNLMLNALRGTGGITHVSAHSAAPGDTGASEIAGATRQPIAFAAPAGGTMDDTTNGAVIPIPAGQTVTHIGFWSAASAGTYYGFVDVADEPFPNGGNYTVTDADLDLNAA